MKRVNGRVLLLVLFFLVHRASWATEEGRAVLRVAAVGGLSLCGVWPRLAEKLERALAIEIQTVVAAPKEGIIPAFSSGEADVLLIHASDAASALQARGLAEPLRAWALNEHVMVGPDEDPAKVRDAQDGVDALRRIAAINAPFVAFRDPGSHAVLAALWREAGMRPHSAVVADGSAQSQWVLSFAAERRAYTIVGHIPVAFGKMPATGLKVLLKGDPTMRRIYVLAEPGSAHPASAEQRALARRFADYLLSPAGQADLRLADEESGGPWIFPLPDRGIVKVRD